MVNLIMKVHSALDVESFARVPAAHSTAFVLSPEHLT